MGCNGSKDTGGDQRNAADPPHSKTNDRRNAAAENKKYKSTMEFLRKVPLMKRLQTDQLPLVASALTARDYEKGAVIISQGVSGDEFFIVRAGEATVQVADEETGNFSQVARLVAGDYFGESALLRDQVRSATVIAETHTTCLTLKRERFQQLGLTEKLQFANRRAVGGGGKAEEEAKMKPPSSKTAADKAFIDSAIRGNETLATLASLDDDRVAKLIEMMWREEVEAGVEIITEGDMNADFFYVVAEGSFTVSCSGAEDQDANLVDDFAAKGDVVNTVTQGGTFGELALMYLVPRVATVTARERSIVWVIERSQFKSVLMAHSGAKVREYTKYLDDVQILQPLLHEEKTVLANALVEMHFVAGENIIQQGMQGNSFYIMYDGEVTILKEGTEVAKLAANKARGTAQHFGEDALLDNSARTATVTVTSKVAKALALDRQDFLTLLGPLKDIIDASRAKVGRKSFASGLAPSSAILQEGGMQRGLILRKDLIRIGLLGSGGFGTVELWEHKFSHQTYAMKGLSKGYVMKARMQESVMNEKNILMMTNSMFVIKLFETYNSSQVLYFLLEPGLGGELYATYNRKSFYGSEYHARFYLSGVVFAFDHLHERRIIYRDLKPENLLLTETGHLKITDMGLAKFVVGKTFSTCGTPDYFAPEIISSSGHNRAVDWWTLGVLVFELMAGHPPFESASPMHIYSKVQRGIKKVPFPPKCRGTVGDLIVELLKHDPSERLPMRPGGSQNIRDHKWFEGFDWAAMGDLSISPPYQPKVKSKKDLSNFCARKENLPKQLEYRDPGTGWDKTFATA